MFSLMNEQSKDSATTWRSTTTLRLIGQVEEQLGRALRDDYDVQQNRNYPDDLASSSIAEGRENLVGTALSISRDLTPSFFDRLKRAVTSNGKKDLETKIKRAQSALQDLSRTSAHYRNLIPRLEEKHFADLENFKQEVLQVEAYHTLIPLIGKELERLNKQYEQSNSKETLPGFEKSCKTKQKLYPIRQDAMISGIYHLGAIRSGLIAYDDMQVSEKEVEDATAAYTISMDTQTQLNIYLQHAKKAFNNGSYNGEVIEAVSQLRNYAMGIEEDHTERVKMINEERKAYRHRLSQIKAINLVPVCNQNGIDMERLDAIYNSTIQLLGMNGNNHQLRK